MLSIKTRQRGAWILAEITDWLQKQPNPSAFKIRWEFEGGNLILGKIRQSGWHFLALMDKTPVCRIWVTVTNMLTGASERAETPIVQSPGIHQPGELGHDDVSTVAELVDSCGFGGKTVRLTQSLTISSPLALAPGTTLNLNGFELKRTKATDGTAVVKLSTCCAVINGSITTDAREDASKVNDYNRNMIPDAFWMAPGTSFCGAWNVELHAVRKGFDLSNGVEASIWNTRERWPDSILMYHGWYGGGKFVSIVDVKQINSPQEHGFRGGLWYWWVTLDGGSISEGDATISGLPDDIRKSAWNAQAGNGIYAAGTVFNGPVSIGPLNGGDGGGKYVQNGGPPHKIIPAPQSQWQWTTWVVLDGIQFNCTGTDTIRIRHGVRFLTGWDCTFTTPEYIPLIIEPAGKFETRSKYGKDAYDYRNVHDVNLINATFNPGPGRKPVDLGQGNERIVINGEKWA